MSIAEYRSSSDIDVVFEDGAVRKHVRYGNFKKGLVAHPDERKNDGRANPRGRHPLRPAEAARIRTGETVVSSCGLEMTITAYRNAEDIDVEFEDGTVREHMRYANFKKGIIARRESKARVART